MDDQLPAPTDATGPAFLPNRDAVRLLEAERALRYRWAAQVAPGRRALDAGCGNGDGARQLIAAGASEVVGIDSVAPAGADELPAGVRFETGDLTRLTHADDSFELITCFGVFEHASDPGAIVEELARVLAPGGLLALSWPGEAAELHAIIEPHLPHLHRLSQVDLALSAVLAGAGEQLTVHGLADAGGDLRLLALAGDRELPEMAPLAVAAGALEVRAWQHAFAAQATALAAARRTAADAEAQLADRDAVARRLLASEQRNAEIPALKLQIADLEYELSNVREREQSARDQIAETERRLTRAQQTLVNVMTSPSWRVTQPLRTAKRLLGS